MARLAFRLGHLREVPRRDRRDRRDGRDGRRIRRASTGPLRRSTAGWPGCAACSSPAARCRLAERPDPPRVRRRPGEAPTLAARLDDAGLPASWRLRRGRGVVTWKSGDTIGLFLRRIGAGGALLELEARQVSRALRGDLNRVLNAESANLQRAVGAAGRQIAAIAELDDDGRLAAQPYVVRVVAEARRETPEATLAELAERLGLHRSAVQRALERVERLALHPDDGAGRRSLAASASGGSRPRRPLA